VWQIPSGSETLSKEEQIERQDKQAAQYQEIDEEMKQFVDQRSVGFVWVYYRK
jgi:hypothetical protein